MDDVLADRSYSTANVAPALCKEFDVEGVLFCDVVCERVNESRVVKFWVEFNDFFR